MKTTSVVAATAPILIVLIFQAYLMLHLNAKIDQLDLQYGAAGNLQDKVHKLPAFVPPHSGCETDPEKKQAVLFY